MSFTELKNSPTAVQRPCCSELLIVSFFNQWIDRLLLIIIATPLPASIPNSTHFTLTNILAITSIT